MRNKLISVVIAAFLPALAFGQSTGTLFNVNATTLLNAVNYSDLQIQLAANYTAASPAGAVAVGGFIASPSARGNGTYLYIVDPGAQKGELVQVVSAVSGVTGRYNVKRGIGGTSQVGHVASAVVLVGSPNAFGAYDPTGACGSTSVNGPTGQSAANLFVNTANGNEWLCSTVTGTWVPGFNNPAPSSAVTTAVASAAGLITPSGPLFHVTGALAVTGFNLPVGFVGGSFSVIADGAFTWTAANNIATASAGASVVSKVYTFTYDFNTSKFYVSAAN